MSINQFIKMIDSGKLSTQFKDTQNPVKSYLESLMSDVQQTNLTWN